VVNVHDQRRHLPGAAAIGLLAASNWAANRRLGDRAYVPWNLALAVALILLARRDGHGWDRLGLGTHRLGAGLTAGTAGAGLVAAVYAGLATSATGRVVFDDDRVGQLTPSEARWQQLVRIPLGTVLAEEIVFRAVLPLLLDQPDQPDWIAEAATAALFGLWHILPSMELHRQNTAMGWAAQDFGAKAAVPAAVLTTTAAGVALHRLRRRSGHLAAPLLVHAATNLVGFGISRRLRRRAG
jgi:uncharacterized protein